MRFAQKAVKHLETESHSTYQEIPKSYFKCYLCGQDPTHMRWTTPMWPDRPLGENKFFHLDCMEKNKPGQAAETLHRNSL